MSDNTIVYSKQPGGQRIPVTVRLDWRPDGSIRPRGYWTPDGSRYEVTHIHETTPLAFLRDKGEGLRVKVQAELTEMPDANNNDDLLHVRRESYLYFEDNRFCGRNMVDGRYGHEGKAFIPVTLDVFPDGEYELIGFTVKDTRYEVDKTLAIEAKGSYHAGGVGLCHRVMAREAGADGACREAALFFEINKWFVSVKPSCNVGTDGIQ